jgi:hypothetical protein
MKGCRPGLAMALGDVPWEAVPTPDGPDADVRTVDGRHVAHAVSSTVAEHIVGLHNGQLYPQP